MRERNVRNGYQAPPRITASNVVDVAWRVGWLKRFLKGPRPAYRNISGEAALTPKQFVELGYQLAREIDPSVSWKDVEDFRARWKGPLLLKGVVSTRDVKTALDPASTASSSRTTAAGSLTTRRRPSRCCPRSWTPAGTAPRSTSTAASGAAATSSRRVALGAKAVLIGRPYVYGLGAAGEDGVDHVFRILTDEIDRCLALIGIPKLSDVTRADLRPAPTLPLGEQREAVPVPAR